MPYPYEAANSYDANTGKRNVEQKNTYAFLNLTGATQLKSGTGFVDLISGQQGSGAINLYDIANGTTASLASLQQIGTFPASSLTIAATGVIPPTTVNFHAQFNNGLYVNTVSTASVAQATLSYS